MTVQALSLTTGRCYNSIDKYNKGAKMTYQGHVENGTVVLDEGVSLPNGLKVTVTLLDFMKDDSSDDENGPTLYERLEPIIGTAKGLPSDASRNVDHYLYGAPKV